MKDASTVTGVGTPTAARPYGPFQDDAVPGDGSGTAVRTDWQSDLYYADIAVMDEVDITPDNSEEDITSSQFKDAVAEMAIKYGNPVGSILDHNPDYPNTPVLSATWLKYYTLANGATISDAASPYNGYRSPNYNGADVVLTGIVWASGVATIPAVDLTALAVGDDVSGGAIASGAYISDITGTTVTLTDTAISATVDTTFTNDGRFIRGGAVSGIGKKDAFQGFAIDILAQSQAAASDHTNPNALCGSVSGVDNLGFADILPTTDGTNGPPRPDSETRPIYTTAVKYFKKL